jgi:hypothetical protein
MRPGGRWPFTWSTPRTAGCVKEHGRAVSMTEGFYRRIGRIDTELLIEVPYFVVRDRGLAVAYMAEGVLPQNSYRSCWTRTIISTGSPKPT